MQGFFVHFTGNRCEMQPLPKKTRLSACPLFFRHLHGLLPLGFWHIKRAEEGSAMKKICLRLATGSLSVFLLATGVQAAETLVPVGRVVGIEIENDIVTVAALEENSPAKAAGLQAGDRLLTIDGITVTGVGDIKPALERSNGSVRLEVCRGKEILSFRVAPQATSQGPKLGLYLRQGVTGIGTVTYYDPSTGAFGALGHGVNTADGQLLEMRDGRIWPAKVASLRKGKAGEPGQLMGSITARQVQGTLTRNTHQGIFGRIVGQWKGEPLPVASAQQIKTGKAVILSTVTGEVPREYSVEILKLYPASRENGRNMLIRITDPALLETTGGIVQGMSGSPIIQDGKLVGAVTHVLVNDPTTGYGIFIENMLDAAA
jgi:stage IV sporulation protein B